MGMACTRVVQTRLGTFSLHMARTPCFYSCNFLEGMELKKTTWLSLIGVNRLNSTTALSFSRPNIYHTYLLASAGSHSDNLHVKDSSASFLKYESYVYKLQKRVNVNYKHVLTTMARRSSVQKVE